MRANAANRLIEHYRRTARVLPWRAPPGTAAPDPYRVWLSEVMLQQTTVAAVIPRFHRFVERWPTVEALAAARDEDVLGEWAGLGYYARARNLIACARKVAATDGFPDTEADLRALPGIGDYTAAAIAAIAFGRRAIVVDTNIARVVARFHGLERPLPESKTELRTLTDAMTPEHGAGDFAQAMMDVGAGICRPKLPLCAQCPLSEDCIAFASGDPERFPPRKAKGARAKRYGSAYWIERGDCVWLVRRPASGLLGGMAALPSTEFGPVPMDERPAAVVRHTFTHFELELAIVETAETVGDGWWQPLARLGEAGMPTLYCRAADAVMAQRSRLAA